MTVLRRATLPRARRPLRVTAFGGGTGLSILLRGLAGLGSHVEITAVVAVSDDGGSTGRLRRSLGLPAVGDARACLSALCDPRGGWPGLLEHRFRRDPGLENHALGNLVLAAACERERLFSRALALAGTLLGARGRVLPATDARPVLVARLADGRVLEGQCILSGVVGPIERLRLSPDLVPPAPGVLEAVETADLIVLGPGSLFSSVIAAALPAGVARALSRAVAPRLLVQNLTTQRGETDEMGVLDHLRAVREHLGPDSVSAVLLHAWNGPPPPQGIVSDDRELSDAGVRAITARLSSANGRGRLHDPRRLARAVWRFGCEAVSGAISA